MQDQAENAKRIAKNKIMLYIRMLFSMLIARLLVPEDYGVIAMLGVFMAVSKTFIDGGFVFRCHFLI